MNKKRYHKQLWSILLLILFGNGLTQLYAQVPGHLFMLPENYQSQMNNPSYLRDDKSWIVAVPGLAGLMIANHSNTSLNDLNYYRLPDQLVNETGFFNNKGRTLSVLSESVAMPLLYLAVPTERGVFKFYLEENIQSSIQFPGRSVLFFEKGIIPESFQNYQSGNINGRLMGYLEAGFGFAKKINESFQAGVTGKILFGSAYAELNNWDFGIESSEADQEIRLSLQGTGKMSVPYAVLLDETGRIQLIDAENRVQKYMLSFKNPGIAVDAGVTYNLDKNNRITVTVADLGLIWYRSGTYDLVQNELVTLNGIDMSDVLNNREGEGYILPLSTMLNARGDVREVYPFISPATLVRVISPKAFLHFQHQYSPGLSFGVTNQTFFYKDNPVNILSGSVLKSSGNFEFFGGLTLHGIQTVTLGAGMQWSNRFLQIFIATDNILAFYHPSDRKSYSVSFGINLLLNHAEDEIKKGPATRNGKTSPYLPFYRRYK